MRSPFIQRPGRNSAHSVRERGVTLALVAVSIFSIIAMAALSIDVGTLYQASAEAQRAADAAALAGVRIVSMSGLTGDPTNGATSGTVSWGEVCGGSGSPATKAAIAEAQQNTVGGTQLLAASISVTYSAASGGVSSGTADCSGAGLGFGVNPVVTVKVTQSSLSTYFSRIWGRTGSSVSATASAEAFNPSNSDGYSPNGVVPVQPRCVKPWIVPNYDPLYPTPPNSPPNYCSMGPNPNCNPLVALSDGTIQNPGILADGKGIIGETFWLVADCLHNQSNCVLNGTAPRANVLSAQHFRVSGPPNLEYLPGQTSFQSVAVPSGRACSGVDGNYAEAIAGCDQSTKYQCGVQNMNRVDLSENPRRSGDTMNGVQCLINSQNGTTGQDVLQLNTATPPHPIYPFQIEIGSGNPLRGAAGVGSTDLITSSTSIVSLPIYDSTAVTSFPGTTTSVTIIGFLQVFINYLDNSGNVNVTVMNVAGCGNAATGTALTGTSPVPVRLITPP
jgi:hypothetical protein